MQPKKFLIASFLLFCTPLQMVAQAPKYIIFGITDVLIKPSMNGVPGARIAKLAGFSIEYVRQMLFDTLRSLHAPQFNKFDTDNPPIVGYWLTRPYTSNYAKNIAMQYVKQHSRFIKRKVLQKAVVATFTPSESIKALKSNQSMISVFDACRQAGHSVYMCDNMNTELFAAIRSRYPSLFSMNDGIQISGNVGLLMSEPAFFKQMIKAQGLDAKNCYFITNNSLAANAASAAGIKSIYYYGDNALSVIRSLRTYNIIT